MLAQSLEAYELFIYALPDDNPSIKWSTLVVIRQASDVATVEGEIIFHSGLRLQMMEVVRFDLIPPRLSRYGYEVWHSNTKLYWYDSQSHPDDPTLASTHPHHKHIPPDIKHHRVPAPGLSFTKPNLPFLIREIEQLGAADEHSA
ncbi:MAG: hypothetical protein DRI37_01465 [Chloroflexi bacterium]|nr:MAG: hypothetical protein DRI37_01465 [Chloroflexota bacterium]